jgi:hypothetical protein
VEMNVFSQRYPTVTKCRGTRCVRGVDRCCPFEIRRWLHFRVQYVEPVCRFEFGRLDTRFEVEA